ncbi:hypothetical protein CSB93_6059 [Pseudomonas paraeruginosa]|uniref:Uncharacterized protein n=1 Tax=Pseudomonas paraeruginosa TaxID=2994495 RepID=A0A2R3IZH8_9PSED|nr:hypothetical protein CSB93_6059 [Pseudomonas paraeruginosa]AWE91629.1 hypothetical protein CSC28_4860 [Pseudomonas paraeruginosa]
MHGRVDGWKSATSLLWAGFPGLFCGSRRVACQIGKTNRTLALQQAPPREVD